MKTIILLIGFLASLSSAYAAMLGIDVELSRDKEGKKLVSVRVGSLTHNDGDYVTVKAAAKVLHDLPVGKAYTFAVIHSKDTIPLADMMPIFEAMSANGIELDSIQIGAGPPGGMDRCNHRSHKSAGAEPESAPATITTIQPQPEIERLQQEFDRRRAEALRPIAAWYRGQLETLQKKLFTEAPGSEAKVAEVLKATKEAFWQEDQPELKQALIRSTWLWRSDYDPHGVPITFRCDGTVEHIGMRGTWRVSGPSEVTITTEDSDRYFLRFNTSLSAYEADHHNVSGIRMQAVH